MSNRLSELDVIVVRIGRLADELRADPDRYVHRSAAELCAAFREHRAVEPALTRMQASIHMLRTTNHDGLRREFQRRAHGLDHIAAVIDNELLPHLRRMGFLD